MRANGLPILSARNTAMIDAVTDLPPVVVSDLLEPTPQSAACSEGGRERGTFGRMWPPGCR